MFEAAVDRLGWAVAGAGSVEVGQDVGGALLQGPPEGDNLGECCRHAVADRKPFLLRIDRSVLDAVQRWADDELRSLNGQIEFLLRRVLKEEGRETAKLKKKN